MEKDKTFNKMKKTLIAYEKEYKKHPNFKEKLSLATKIFEIYKSKAEEPLRNMQAALTVYLDSVKESEQAFKELFELLAILDMKDLRLIDKKADAYLRTFKKMLNNSLKEVYDAHNS